MEGLVENNIGFRKKFIYVVGGMFLGVMVTILSIGFNTDWFRPEKIYHIKFTQGFNLHPASEVRMLNTLIGKVVKTQISRGVDELQVIITIKVLAEYTDLIRQDSLAEVQFASLVQNSPYLSITPGSLAYPIILESGTIPSLEANTHSSTSK